MKKIKLSDYEITTTLGLGTFGRVRLARQKNSNNFYAIKILKKNDIVKSKQIDHVQNQCHILVTLAHPFIVTMEGFAQDQKYLYFLLQYVPGGQLLTYLRNVSYLQSQQAAIYTAQIVLIFEYLHSKNIIFRDLKPQNLLIAADGYLKLTDFTFAKYVENKTYTLCGTPQYLAPQILLNQGHGKGVDWWTLGILIYEMIAGIDPFTDEDPMIIYQNILKGQLRFTKNFDKDAKSLVKHLLVADVAKRYGMLKNGVDDVKNHRWLNKIDFKALYAKKVQMSHKPKVQSAGDTSNFSAYPDSQHGPVALSPNQDPFTDW